MSGPKKPRKGRFPLMCQSGLSDVTQHARNNRQSHSVKKPKMPVRLANWFEGKSAVSERPRVRRAASASNFQAGHARWYSETGITLPKPSPPTSREFFRNNAASSSSHGDRNKGSREHDVYHLPAAPPGSYRDDDTGPSPTTLLRVVSGMKGAVAHFAKVLIADINKHPVQLEFLKQSILHEVEANVDKANRWKFLVQAFICKRFLEGFSSSNGYFGLEDFQTDNMSTLNSFADFTKFKDKAASISMLLDADAPDFSFLGRFCFKKFKSIFGEVASNLPLPIYQDEMYWVARGRHPRTGFYQNFLKVAVSVWLLHRLAHSFDQKVDLLTYAKGSPFQRETMESVIPGFTEEANEENDVNMEVFFSVIPGFQVNNSVAKCEVYLRDKVKLPHPMETCTHKTPVGTSTDKTPVGTSTDKTPVRTSSNKIPVKTSTNKTPALKPHTPEMTVRDYNSPGSVQTSESFSSYSNPPVRPPPTAGDVVSSGPGVKADMAYWNGYRDSLSPGQQGNGSRSGRKSRNEHESFAETHPGSNSRDTTVHRMPAPQSLPSSQRGLNYVARPTKLSESRRLANLRQTPSG